MVISMMLRIVKDVVYGECMKVLIIISSLEMNGESLGSDIVDRLVIRKSLVRIGVIFLMLLKLWIFVDLWCLIR